MTEEKITIKINVDQARLGELVTVDEWCEAEEGQLRAIRSVLGKFVVDSDGNFMAPEAGKKIIGKLTIAELRKLSEEFQEQAKTAAVPPQNAAD